MERITLHIVGGDSRSRAEQARIAFALGHHAEVYADLGELLDRPPRDGIVLAAETGEPGAARRMFEAFGEAGIWSPAVMTAHEIKLEQVVAGVRAGALDYLALPLEMSSFARRLHAIAEEVGPYQERRRSEVEAQRRIGQLSARERQVLALLSAGLANKEIAQQLQISPRTVEIHRANMMRKLSAGHPADAIKAWISAASDRAAPPAEAAPHRRPRFRVVAPATAASDVEMAEDRRRHR